MSDSVCAANEDKGCAGALEKKYSWATLTFAIVFGFMLLYGVSYFVSAVSYNALSDVPADRSRGISMYYYTFWFSFLPYFGLGFMLYNLQRGYLLRLLGHTLAIAFVIEKGGLVLLATLLARGFPSSWYGIGYPHAGYALMCEELPFYCGTTAVNVYLFGGTLLGAVMFIAGALTARRLINRFTRKDAEA
ncbi:hypothetical protein [Paenibacillus sp. y28]|uniref:hypothetical protein n=1 Tax=Paenibacillus sp. y28 TaxID=3129110 RepID=UPI003019EA1B